MDLNSLGDRKDPDLQRTANSNDKLGATLFSLPADTHEPPGRRPLKSFSLYFLSYVRVRSPTREDPYGSGYGYIRGPRGTRQLLSLLLILYAWLF